VKISVVVPCYNESEGIPQLALALAEVRPMLEPAHRLELVFVDDGSTDDTRATLEHHFGRLPEVRIVSHPRNRGLGAALRTGFGHATGECIVTIDSDCTYNPRELPQLIRLLEKGADVVVASPYHPAGGVFNVPRYRLFLSHNLSRLYDVVLGSRIYTYTSLFRVYRAGLLRRIHFESDGFLAMAELLVGALGHGAKVVEHPTVLSLRQYGESKAALARLTRQHLRFLGRLLVRRLKGRTAHAVAADPASAAEALRVARHRDLGPGVDLARWNEELNRTHGMAVLTDHPSLLVRWHERDRKRRILRMVRSRPTDLVVEVGSERGGLSSRIAGSCRYLVCVDIDAGVLADARREVAGRRTGFVVADAQALPLRSACADITVSAHTLEHLPDPSVGLRELTRVTSPGGSMAINVPNDRWVLILKRIVSRLLGRGRLLHGLSPGLAPGHLWVFDPGLLRKLSDGVVALGPLSFNVPFFTNIFATGRPCTADAESTIRRERPMNPPVQLPRDDNATGRDLGDEEIALVAQAIKSGCLTSTKGTMVKGLEEGFAGRYGSRHCVAMSSGTAALHVAVAAVDPEPGDEIITSPITDMGAIAPILYQGAIPIFADVDPDTYNVTAETIAGRITSRTRAIMVTHLFGNPCDMDPILALAGRHGLPVIEDCSQAYFAEYRGRRVGTLGAVGCFSLQQGKHMTCGEGGLVVTDDPAAARRMRLFVNKAWGYGDPNPDHYFLALNYRMTELQGAVALAQLEKVEGVVARRRRVAAELIQRCGRLPGLAMPVVTRDSVHSYWKFPVQVDEDVLGDVAAFARRLAELGVVAQPRYIQKPAFECEVLRDQRTFGSSGVPFRGLVGRDAAVKYERSEYPGTLRALSRVLVMPINEFYGPEHLEFIGAAVDEAVKQCLTR